MTEEEATVSSCCHRMTLAYIESLQTVLDVLIRKLVGHMLGGIKVIAEDQGLS